MFSKKQKERDWTRRIVMRCGVAGGWAEIQKKDIFEMRSFEEGKRSCGKLERHDG